MKTKNIKSDINSTKYLLIKIRLLSNENLNNKIKSFSNNIIQKQNLLYKLEGNTLYVATEYNQTIFKRVISNLNSISDIFDTEYIIIEIMDISKLKSFISTFQ